MIILYHASKVIVGKPDVIHSRESLDFGKGFYLTRLKAQAEKYAERFLRIGYSAFLNVYRLDDDLTGFTTHVFDKYDGEWLDYIVACRRLQSHTMYDIIEGGIANDKVYNTVDLYMQGIFTKEQALDQLIYKKPNNQICITSQQLIDSHLHFVKSIQLG